MPFNKLDFMIDNFFKSFNYQPIFCQVANIRGQICFLNEFYKTTGSIITNDNVNKMMIPEFIRCLTASQFKDEYYNQLTNIYDSVYKSKVKKTLLCNRIDKRGNQYTCQFNIFPLFDTDGQLLGTYTVSWHVNPLKILRHFDSIVENKSIMIDLNGIDLILTIREIEIIFLLLYKFSQYEIASILNVSRGTIQKNIENKLYSKFGITTHKLSDLIKKAKLYNLGSYFPPTLLQNKVIELDDCNQVLESIANLIRK